LESLEAETAAPVKSIKQATGLQDQSGKQSGQKGIRLAIAPSRLAEKGERAEA
jgi:hypothetical protein